CDLNGILLILPEQIVIQLVRRAEFRSVDGLNDLHGRLQFLFAPVDRFERNITPTIILARISDYGGELRAFLHRMLPIQLEQYVKALTVLSLFCRELRAVLFELRSLTRRCEAKYH